MTRLVWAVILGVAPLLAGCAVRPVITAATDGPHEGHRLEPGDAIQIRYTRHPELSQDDVIRPDGKIKAKILGEITAAGMTPKELETAIQKGVADQVKDPDVVVSVIRFSEKLVYVGGEVVRPGTIPYRKGMTALQAIAEAGGFRDTARVDSVILVRSEADSENTFPTSKARKLNLGQAVQPDSFEEPIPLAPHDVIFVPRTDIADVDAWVRPEKGFFGSHCGPRWLKPMIGDFWYLDRPEPPRRPVRRP